MNGLAAFPGGQTKTRGLSARVLGGLWRGYRRDVKKACNHEVGLKPEPSAAAAPIRWEASIRHCARAAQVPSSIP